MRVPRLCLALALALVASAQDAAPARLAYDVVSLKLRHGDINVMSGPFIKGRTVTGEALTVRDFLTYAYDLRYDQLSGGPDWAASEHFDLSAKSDGAGVLPLAQSRRMMQSLLEDRFHLRSHFETHDAPAYFLTVAKGAPKLKPVDASEKGGAIVRSIDKGMLRLETTRSSMEYLTRQLANTAVRPVIDHTGLTGFFAFTLEWFPANRPEPVDVDVPSMFAAVQEQLGLKLESGRAPFQKFVIDSVDHPGEN